MCEVHRIKWKSPTNYERTEKEIVALKGPVCICSFAININSNKILGDIRVEKKNIKTPTRWVPRLARSLDNIEDSLTQNTQKPVGLGKGQLLITLRWYDIIVN